MNIFIKNKTLIYKYLCILISNILLSILCNFYLKNFVYKDVILILLVVISDLIIYLYKDKCKFKYLYDFIFSIILGLLFMFIRDKNLYVMTLFILFMGNNIIFMKSRISEKVLKKGLQYFLIPIISFIEVFLSGFIYFFLFVR